MDRFAEHWDKQYPTISRLWRRHWDHLSPFFAFPQEIRKVIYTTNAIESMNRGLRKIIKTKGAFPTDEAAQETALSGSAQSVPKVDPGPLSTGRPPSTSSSSCTKTECPSHETVSYTKSVTDPVDVNYSLQVRMTYAPIPPITCEHCRLLCSFHTSLYPLA